MTTERTIATRAGGSFKLVATVTPDARCEMCLEMESAGETTSVHLNPEEVQTLIEACEAFLDTLAGEKR